MHAAHRRLMMKASHYIPLEKGLAPLRAIQGMGDGATTFTGTNRTRINPETGLMEILGANVPVIEANGLSSKGAAVNILLKARTFTEAAGWTFDNSTTVKNATGVDGVANVATTITDADAVNAGNIRKIIEKSVADSTTFFALSLSFAKTTTATTFPYLQLYFAVGTAKSAAYFLNTNTGVATAGTITAANIGVSVKSKGLFWRLSIWATDNGSNTEIRNIIYPAASSDGTSFDATATGSCVIDAIQLELTAHPTSFIDSPEQLATMEDLSGWEAAVGGDGDGADRLTTYGTTTFLVTGLDNDEISHRYNDGGAGAYNTTTGFMIQFYFNVDAVSDAHGYSPLAIAESNKDLYVIDNTDSGDALFTFVDNSGGTRRITLFELNSGTLTQTASPITISEDTDYYNILDVIDGGTYRTLRLRVYSDSSKDTLVGTATKELTKAYAGSEALQYAGIVSYASGGGGVSWTGTISNIAFTAGNVQLVLDGGMNATKLGANSVTGDDNDFDTIGNWTTGGLATFTANDDVAGKAYLLGDAGDDYITLATMLTVGKTYYLTLKIELDPLDAGGMGATNFRCGSTLSTLYPGFFFDVTPTTTEVTYSGYFIARSTSLYLGQSTDTDGFDTIAFSIDDVTLQECTFKYWTAGVEWSPGASAGSLTGKANKVAGTASAIYQNSGLVAEKVYRASAVTTVGVTSANLAVGQGATAFTVNASGTYYGYAIRGSNGNTLITGNSTFVGTVDDVSVFEHGEARLTEAGATVWTMPTALTTLLAAAGSFVATITFGFDKGDSTGSDVGLYSFKDAADGGIFLDDSNSEQISFSDGTNIATLNTAYVKNTEYKISGRFDTGLLELGVKVSDSWAWNDAGAFDGSLNPGTDLIIGKSNELPFHIKDITFYDTQMSRAFFERYH